MTRRVCRLLVICTVSLLGGCAAPAAPDLVLLNARVFTADVARPWAEALAVRNGRLVAVGDTTEIARLAGPDTRSIDAAGRTVVPGLNDAYARIAGRGDAGELAAMAADAVRYGITSIQLASVHRPIDETVRIVRAGETSVRWRLMRYPRLADGDGEESTDSRPFLPPQPGNRIDARGMAWSFPGVPGSRHPNLSLDRLPQIASWAYGSEDPLVVATADDADARAYLAALEGAGVPDVWRAKRPRLVAGAALADDLVSRARELGVIIIYVPGRGAAPIGPLVDAGLTVALGSDGVLNPYLNLQRESAAARPADAAMARQRAIVAYTLGSAMAEHAEREKGTLTVGKVADLAVLSGDPFTLEPVRLPMLRSVLTIIDGEIEYDAGILVARAGF